MKWSDDLMVEWVRAKFKMNRFARLMLSFLNLQRILCLMNIRSSEWPNGELQVSRSTTGKSSPRWKLQVTISLVGGTHFQPVPRATGIFEKRIRGQTGQRTVDGRRSPECLEWRTMGGRAGREKELKETRTVNGRGGPVLNETNSLCNATARFHVYFLIPSAACGGPPR